MKISDLLDKEITIRERRLDGEVVSSNTWKIKEIYKHHVLGVRYADDGTEIRECFSTGTLIEQGIIKGNGKLTRIRLNREEI